jgi:hypothetical protein
MLISVLRKGSESIDIWLAKKFCLAVSMSERTSAGYGMSVDDYMMEMALIE